MAEAAEPGRGGGESVTPGGKGGRDGTGNASRVRWPARGDDEPGTLRGGDCGASCELALTAGAHGGGVGEWIELGRWELGLQDWDRGLDFGLLGHFNYIDQFGYPTLGTKLTEESSVIEKLGPN